MWISCFGLTEFFLPFTRNHLSDLALDLDFGVAHTIFGVSEFSSNAYSYSGFLFKDDYTIDKSYVPVFYRIADLLYLSNLSRQEILNMPISELNMLHFILHHKKMQETKYWSDYFISLAKAMLGGEGKVIE
ncbi:MAG: hypothetical protein RML35_00790 [Chloroherpetonaceae bacterium]|nr:hypothetical protein [Chloroherpetonaceae bacterium]